MRGRERGGEGGREEGGRWREREGEREGGREGGGEDKTVNNKSFLSQHQVDHRTTTRSCDFQWLFENINLF